jgi:hypothetical protein
MSRELDYFPPKGTKFQWGSKELQYSPWYCNLGKQREPGIWPSPLSVLLCVDLIQGQYKWHVKTWDFSHRSSNISGVATTALEACLAAECAGERFLDEQLPDWVRVALANNWRPPA